MTATRREQSYSDKVIFVFDMRKVFEIALETDGVNIVKKFVVAECLDGLLKKAQEEFGLQDSKCIVVSYSGIAIENDEVLDLLYESKGSSFCLKQIESDPLDIHTLEAPPAEEAQQQLTQQEEQLAVAAESPVDFDTIDGSLDYSSEYYDVPKIIHVIRKARGGISGEDLLFQLKSASICGYNLAGLVIHAAGTWLMKNCSELKEPFRPSPGEFLKMAKSITKYFPSMENQVSVNTWDIIYDGRTHKSILERYVRQKRSREGKTIRKRKVSDINEGPLPTKKQRLSIPSESFSDETVIEAEQFMTNGVVDQSNKQLMLHKLYVTRASRRQFISHQNSQKSSSFTLILNKYQLFVRLNEAVEEKFTALTGKQIQLFMNSWERARIKVLNCAAAECPKGKTAIVEAKMEEAREAGVDFDIESENAAILELLLYLLPNATAKELPKGVKTWDCLSLIVQRFEEGTTMREALQRASEMIQPGILIIGKDDHFIKIEQLFMKIPIGNFVISLAYLLAYYYILEVEYPLPLKYVFVFLESLCEIPLSKPFVIVKKLISRLAA